MKLKQLIPITLSLLGVLSLSQCKEQTKTSATDLKTTEDLHGYQSLEEYGEHLVMIAGCHDCHTPKKMGPHGPELDFDLALSGHPSDLPLPELDRKDLENKGVAATQTLTAWVGPWGISYTANLTSDETGIGSWTEDQFFIAIREGKYKGMRNARTLLPPMPWEMFKEMNDQEIKAIFAYLKSTQPISNVVPNAEPPLGAL